MASSSKPASGGSRRKSSSSGGSGTKSQDSCLHAQPQRRFARRQQRLVAIRSELAEALRPESQWLGRVQPVERLGPVERSQPVQRIQPIQRVQRVTSGTRASSQKSNGVVDTVKSAASKAGAPALAVGAAAAGVAGGLILRGRSRRRKVLGIPLPGGGVDVKSVAKSVGKASKQLGQTSKSVSKDIERVGDQAERFGKILGLADGHCHVGQRSVGRSRQGEGREWLGRERRAQGQGPDDRGECGCGRPRRRPRARLGHRRSAAQARRSARPRRRSGSSASELSSATRRASATADEVRQVREQLDRVNRRSPVEVLLDGLTHRRGAHKLES